MSPRPFLKWAGGKNKIVADIVEKLEEDGRQWFPSNGNRYIEPFFGGGAVFFHLVRKEKIDPFHARISDLEPSLINTLQILQHKTRRQKMIRRLQVLEDDYHAFQEQNGLEADDADSRNERMYYLRREDLRNFQRIPPKNIANQIEWAALMVFLNKTCFNGLWRVNSSGEFNVPEGRYQMPNICNEEILSKVGETLEAVTKIRKEAYKEAMEGVKEGDLVYLDPPYFPLEVGKYVFKDYTEEGFDDEQQKELAQAAAKAVSKGARVVASNNFLSPRIEDLYNGAAEEFGIPAPAFIPIPITRTMSSIGEDRIEISEVLILMHPDSKE